MAGSKSNYLEHAVLNHVLGATAYTQPTARYVALYTVAPSDTGGGTEVSGNGYARSAVTFGAALSGSVCPSADVAFPIATPAGWGTVVAFGIFDALSGGNLLYWGTLSVSVAVAALDAVYFDTTTLTIAED